MKYNFQLGSHAFTFRQFNPYATKFVATTELILANFSPTWSAFNFNMAIDVLLTQVNALELTLEVFQ